MILPGGIYVNEEEIPEGVSFTPKTDPEIVQGRRESLESLGLSLMDREAKKCTFAAWERDPQTRRLFEICRRYVEKWEQVQAQNYGLFFYGDTGVGKTYAALSIANALEGKGVDVFVSSPLLMVDCPDARALRQMMRVDLLILDDLGAERDTSYAMERVYSLIDARYRAGKPMIITSNETPEQLRKQGNLRKNRVFDRILGCCWAVKVEGKSFRAARQKKIADSMSNLLGV